MPFGKYKDQLLIDLPEPYVMWFAREGFPEGKLGYGPENGRYGRKLYIKLKKWCAERIGYLRIVETVWGYIKWNWARCYHHQKINFLCETCV